MTPSRYKMKSGDYIIGSKNEEIQSIIEVTPFQVPVYAGGSLLIILPTDALAHNSARLSTVTIPNYYIFLVF